MTKLYIEIQNGSVARLISTDPHLEVWLVDKTPQIEEKGPSMPFYPDVVSEEEFKTMVDGDR